MALESNFPSLLGPKALPALGKQKKSKKSSDLMAKLRKKKKKVMGAPKKASY